MNSPNYFTTLVLCLILIGCESSTYTDIQSLKSERIESSFIFTSREIKTFLYSAEKFDSNVRGYKFRVGSGNSKKNEIANKLRSLSFIHHDDVIFDKSLGNKVALDIYYIQVPVCNSHELQSRFDSFGCSLNSNMNVQISNPENIFR